MSERRPGSLDDPKVIHELKNQLSIIAGFSSLLLEDSAPDDDRRVDYEEIHKAALRSLAILATAMPPE